jgi:hypothetical protein
MKLLRKIPPAIVLFIGLLSVFLSIFGAFWRWWSVAGGALAAAVFIVQFMAQGNTTITFTANDWQKNGDSYQFSAGRYHGKGLHPNVVAYMRSTNDGYEEVICDVQTLESGEVLIEASNPFDGQVRIS